MSRTVSILVLSAVVSCTAGVEVEPSDNPPPVLEAVEPAVLIAGQSQIELRLLGNGFVEGAQGTWNGAPRPTELVSATELLVTLDPADVQAPASASVAVSTPAPGGGTSESVAVEIGYPPPVLDSVSPASVEALTPAITLRVFGSGFTANGGGTRASFGGVPVPTAVLSATELEIQVADYLLRRGRTVEVTAASPDPGGGVSGAVAFSVSNPVPVLTSVEPDSLRLQAPAQVRITGSGFVLGSTVWLDSTAYQPQQLSATSLVFEIPHSGPARGSGRLRVEAPGPGGGWSNELDVLVAELMPGIVGMLPTALGENGGAQTVRVFGFDFAPDAVLHWNGQPLPTTFGAGDPEAGILDTLIATLPAEEALELGSDEVTVVNPRDGGPSAPWPTGVVPTGRILTVGPYIGARLSALNGTDATTFEVGPEDPNGVPMRLDALDVLPTGELVYTKAYGFIELPGLYVRTLGEPEELISGASVEALRVSPDGQWIYYQIEDASDFGVRHIRRMRPDGSDDELVRANARDADPSPDDSRLVLRDETQGSLGLLDLATGTFTSLGVSGAAPQWAPDGSWIAYTTPGGRLRLIRPDGTGDQPLPGPPRSVDFAGMYDWSPDSRFILAVEGRFELIDVATGVGIRFGLPNGGDDIFPTLVRVRWIE